MTYSSLQIRPLASSDCSRGHLDILSVLTVAPQLTSEVYQCKPRPLVPACSPKATFNELKSAKNTYFIVVILQKSTDKVNWRAIPARICRLIFQIVASGTIVLERKLLRNAGLIGHVEDIAVSKAMQGRKLGLKLINTLDAIGAAMGCYKIILDCSKDNIGKLSTFTFR